MNYFLVGFGMLNYLLLCTHYVTRSVIICFCISNHSHWDIWVILQSVLASNLALFVP